MFSDIHIHRLLRGFLAFLVLTLSAFLPLKQMHTPVSSVLWHAVNADWDADSGTGSDDYSESSEEQAPGDFGLATPAPPKLKWRKVVAPASTTVFVPLTSSRIHPIREPVFRAESPAALRPEYYRFLFRYSLF